MYNALMSECRHCVDILNSTVQECLSSKEMQSGKASKCPQNVVKKVQNEN